METTTPYTITLLYHIDLSLGPEGRRQGGGEAGLRHLPGALDRHGFTVVFRGAPSSRIYAAPVRVEGYPVYGPGDGSGSSITVTSRQMRATTTLHHKDRAIFILAKPTGVIGTVGLDVAVCNALE
ncbi:hypothetical protein CEP51_016489 [Fusarium floridanum]|uniref:Uncharacterized protein n=1 Tax=Fusarium floridanum TaxID=1325733 RepID=A0A428NNH2_9HYPO|nr:hypothetical protein CEP51_016489 [Fusarium floridanum]